MTLEQTVDEIGFEMILRNHPKVVKQIGALLDRGITAEQIEKRFQAINNHATINLIICAAHYMEAQRKAK